MSMIWASGRDPLDHAVAGADEVVLETEVGEEGDEHRLCRVYDVGRRRGDVALGEAGHSRGEPLARVRQRLRDDAQPGLPRRPRGLGPDRDDRETRRRAPPSALADEAEVRTTRSAAGNSFGWSSRVR